MLMEEKDVQKKSSTNVSFAWLFQLIASLSWIVSVFVYGSWGLGDFLQILAASSWTVSNVFALFDKKKGADNSVHIDNSHAAFSE